MEKRKMIKSVLSTGALAALALSLTACGSEKNEVSLWNPFTGSDGEFMQKIVDEYNATDPEIKIKNVTVPDMYSKINTVMNSNKDKDVPDLTVMHVERAELFQSQGIIDPMTKVLEGHDSIKEENYVKSAWDGGEVEGVRYFVPLDVHSSPMYYNKDLLDKYAPNALDDGAVTIEEIEEITPKAKADGNITYPINVEGWTAMALTSSQGGKIEQDGIPTINTPEMKKSFEALNHFYEIGATQEDGDEPVQAFQTGKAVFLQGGTWDISGLNEVKDLNWGITNTPTFDAKVLANWTSSHQFGLLKKERSDEKIKAIGDFLDYVRENSQVWAESGQNVASREIFESEDYKKYPQSFLVSDQKELDSLKIYDFKNNGITQDAINTYARDMVFGRMDITEGLEKAQQQVDDKLKEGK